MSVVSEDGLIGHRVDETWGHTVVWYFDDPPDWDPRYTAREKAEAADRGEPSPQGTPPDGEACC